MPKNRKNSSWHAKDCVHGSFKWITFICIMCKLQLVYLSIWLTLICLSYILQFLQMSRISIFSLQIKGFSYLLDFLKKIMTNFVTSSNSLNWMWLWLKMPKTYLLIHGHLAGLSFVLYICDILGLYNLLLWNVSWIQIGLNLWSLPSFNCSWNGPYCDGGILCSSKCCGS